MLNPIWEKLKEVSLSFLLFACILLSAAVECQAQDESSSALGVNRDGVAILYPVMRAGAGTGQVMDASARFAEVAVGAGLIYKRLLLTGSYAGIIPVLSYPYRFDTDSNTCQDQRTEKPVASRFCGSDPDSGSTFFETGLFSVNYAVPVPEDRLIIGLGLRTGDLGTRPYIAARWIPSDTLFFGWTIQARAGTDFLQLAVSVSTIALPIPIN